MKYRNWYIAVGILCFIIIFTQFGLFLNQPYMRSGLRIRTTDNGFEVGSVPEKGPAGKAGLRVGYHILKINDIDTREFIKTWGYSTNTDIFTHYSSIFHVGETYVLKTVSGATYSFVIPEKQNLLERMQCISFEFWIILTTSFLFVLLGFISVFFTKTSSGMSAFVLFMFSAGLCILNSYTYVANTIFYSSLNIIFFDIFGSLLCYSFIKCVSYFSEIENTLHHKTMAWKIASLFSPATIALKYFFIIIGLDNFLDSRLFFLVYALLAIVLLFSTITVCFLLRRIPRQSSILLRFFLMGLGLGAIPTVGILAVRVLTNSYYTSSSVESFYTIAPLLLVPIALTSALFQTNSVKSDVIAGKIMTAGGTLIVILLFIMFFSSVVTNFLPVAYVLIFLIPFVYMALEKPITLFLFPRLEYMQKNLDELEKSIFLCDNLEIIYCKTADWVMSTINAGFVCIYALPVNGYLNNNGSILYNRELFPKNQETIDSFIDERISNIAKQNEILIHRSDGFSVPLYRSHELFGYIFVGGKPGKEVFSNAEIKLIPSVARILMESVMMYEIIQYKKRSVKIHDAFSKYLSSSVVENLMENPELITMNGVKKQLTIMFTDLQGFTTLSEQTDASALVRILNHYLNQMSSVILEAGGTIDKYEGDAIMCFFGDPVPMQDNAQRCCIAALKMLEMEKRVNEELIAEGLLERPLHTRIGINSGEVVVGNIGSVDRLEYTIIGKQVNIASRIEQINKEHDTSILISEFTYERVKNEFDCEKVDDVILRGLSSPISLYELKGLKNKKGAV